MKKIILLLTIVIVGCSKDDNSVICDCDVRVSLRDEAIGSFIVPTTCSEYDRNGRQDDIEYWRSIGLDVHGLSFNYSDVNCE